jgi:hypothetical protein
MPGCKVQGTNVREGAAEVRVLTAVHDLWKPSSRADFDSRKDASEFPSKSVLSIVPCFTTAAMSVCLCSL